MEVQVLENVKHLEHWILLCYVKQKSAIDPITGDVNYELIINSLPQNFNELPYSQRKKLVKSFSESIDYSQFSLFAKNYLGSSVGSRTPRGSISISGGGGGNGNGSGSTNSSFQEGIEQEVSIP